MLSDREIVEQVMAPGNLVHGTSAYGLASHAEHGIRTPFSFAGETASDTSKRVCFALLGEHRLPHRYKVATHFGPRFPYPLPEIGESVGIIVSGPMIQNVLKDQVFAIGDFFWNTAEQMKRPNHYKIEGNSVYGFPIRPEFGKHWWDEVRVYPKDPLNVSVPNSLWKGLTVFENQFPHLGWLFERLTPFLSQPLPILSEDSNLLARDVRELASNL